MYIFLALLSFATITITLSYNPSCSSCKFFIPDKNIHSGLGLCKMFQNTVYEYGKGTGYIRLYNFAAHCRNDEKLCGNPGYLYEPNVQEKNRLLHEYDELSNKCCGEVNEQDELDELEREFAEVFAKMKRYNTARKYKSS